MSQCSLNMACVGTEMFNIFNNKILIIRNIWLNVIYVECTSQEWFLNIQNVKHFSHFCTSFQHKLNIKLVTLQMKKMLTDYCHFCNVLTFLSVFKNLYTQELCNYVIFHILYSSKLAYIFGILDTFLSLIT